MEKCYFCGKDPAFPEAYIKTWMHQVVSRTHSATQSRVRFLTRAVPVPRCRSCAKLHAGLKSQAIFFVLGYIVVFYVIVGIARILGGPEGDFGGWLPVVLLVSPFVAWGGHALVVSKRLAGRGSKPKKAFRLYPGILELKAENYRLGARPAPAGTSVPDPIIRVRVKRGTVGNDLPAILIFLATQSGNEFLSDYFIYAPEIAGTYEKAVEDARRATAVYARKVCSRIEFPPDL